MITVLNSDNTGRTTILETINESTKGWLEVGQYCEAHVSAISFFTFVRFFSFPLRMPAMSFNSIIHLFDFVEAFVYSD
jgi:hypothetical protein